MAVLSRVRRYVPEVGGNRDLSEEEQIVALMKSINVYDRQVHIRKFIKMKPEEVANEMMSDKGSNEIKKILFDNVTGFIGLTVEDTDAEGNNVSRPATIKDIWDMGEFQLCMELFNNILNSSQLAKDVEKNSESPSGSTLTSETPEPEAVH